MSLPQRGGVGNLAQGFYKLAGDGSEVIFNEGVSARGMVQCGRALHPTLCWLFDAAGKFRLAFGSSAILTQIEQDRKYFLF